MAFKDMTGQKFGRLKVVGHAGFVLRGSKQKKLAAWYCVCDCGQSVKVAGASLRNGNTQSCGCINREITVSRSTTHGHAKKGNNSKEYTTYLRMIARCNNPNSEDFADYMGRGITVCDRWLESFQNFLDDMGHAPSPSHSIDRIDNSLGYFPDNCRWATPTQQARNKRTTRVIVVNGEETTIGDIVDRTGRPYTSIMYRVKHNIPLDDWL